MKDAKLRHVYVRQMHMQYNTEHSLAKNIIASRTRCLVSGRKIQRLKLSKKADPRLSECSRAQCSEQHNYFFAVMT